MKKDYTIQTIDTLHKQWVLSLSVKRLAANEFVFENVFRIGLGWTSWGKPGDRSPGIWFKSDKLFFGYLLEHWYAHTESSAIGQWEDIEISQLLIDGKYQIQIRIGTQIVYTLELSSASYFKNMQVMAGGPGWQTATAEISNLNITTFYDGSAECITTGKISCKCKPGYEPVRNGYVYSCKQG